MRNVSLPRGIDIESVESSLTILVDRPDEEIKKYADHLYFQLGSANYRHRNEFDIHLVAGEEGVANLGEAALALLTPRYQRMSKKTKVRVWPTPLEAWMQSEIVAAGIAGANEYDNGIIVSPDREERLREQLTATALGLSHDEFARMNVDSNLAHDN